MYIFNNSIQNTWCLCMLIIMYVERCMCMCIKFNVIRPRSPLHSWTSTTATSSCKLPCYQKQINLQPSTHKHTQSTEIAVSSRLINIKKPHNNLFLYYYFFLYLPYSFLNYFFFFSLNFVMSLSNICVVLISRMVLPTWHSLNKVNISVCLLHFIFIIFIDIFSLCVLLSAVQLHTKYWIYKILYDV